MAISAQGSFGEPLNSLCALRSDTSCVASHLHIFIMVQVDIKHTFLYFHHGEMVVLQLGIKSGVDGPEKMCRIAIGGAPWCEWHGFWRWLQSGTKLELGVQWRARMADWVRVVTLERLKGGWLWIEQGILMQECEYF